MRIDLDLLKIMFVFSKEDCVDSMSVMIIPTFSCFLSFIFYINRQLYFPIFSLYLGIDLQPKREYNLSLK